MHPFDHPSVRRLILTALEEDIGRGDATTAATVPSGVRAEGTIRAKEDLVAAGLPLAERVLALLDPGCRVRALAREGEEVRAGAAVIEAEGEAAALLTGERVVLNFVQHLCGVATVTRRFVEAVAGTGCRIVDTRKTMPGLRLLEKYAVVCGGGVNHRLGLDD